MRQTEHTDKLFLVAVLALTIGVPISLSVIYYFAESVQYLVALILILLVFASTLGFIVTLNRDRIINSVSSHSRNAVENLTKPLANSLISFQKGDNELAEVQFSAFSEELVGRYAWFQTRKWILTGTTALLLGFSALVGSALLKQQNDLIQTQNEFFRQQIDQQQQQISAQQRVANQTIRSEAINRIYGPTFEGNPRVKAEAVRSLVAVERVFIEEGENTLPTDYINLHEANLDEAWLDSADLEKVSFRKASLNRANFNAATLTEAVFRFSQLKGATFISTSAPNFHIMFSDATNSILSSADLSGSNINQSIMKGADLSGANLKGASFYMVDLRGANLQGIVNWKEIANIEGTNILEALNPPEGFVEWAIMNGAISDRVGLDDLPDRITDRIALEETNMQ